MFFRVSSISSAGISAFSRSSEMEEKSIGMISGRISNETENSRSAPSLKEVISTLGWAAGRRLRSEMVLPVPSFTACSSTSPMMAAAYFCRTIFIGTLPGRKPGSFTVRAISSRRAWVRASS